MKKALILGIVGAAVLFSGAGYPWSAGNFFSSDAERDRARAEKLRDEAAYLEAKTRARMQTATIESDEALKQLFIDQIRDRDRQMKAVYEGAAMAKGKAELYWWLFCVSCLACICLFCVARSAKEAEREARKDIAKVYRQLSISGASVDGIKIYDKKEMIRV